MKSLQVTCAIIEKDGKFFCTQRGYGPYKDFWEFPGGKLEPGETGEECIVREIREELKTEVRVVKYLGTAEHDYPEFHICLMAYLCEIVEGHLQLLEHEAAQWVEKDKLDEVDWLPADRTIIPLLKKIFPNNLESEEKSVTL